MGQRIITLLAVSILLSPSISWASVNTGHPTGKLRNRYFTHPMAADVYIQRDYTLRKKKNKQVYRPVLTKGKIWTTDKSLLDRSNLKGNELKSLSDNRKLLISGINQ